MRIYLETLYNNLYGGKMNNTTLNDIYVYTFFDSKTNSISTGLLKSVEEFAKVCNSKDIQVMSYFNITGENIKIGKTEVLNTIEVAE